MQNKYRIVMIGPHGERDYVHKILEDGIPCTGDDDVEYAAIYSENSAKIIVASIKKYWLHPHISVEIELVTD